MRLLVAVDLSPVSDAMLDAVRTVPRRDGLDVVIVHVAEPDPDFVGWEAGPGVVREQVAAEFQRERRAVETMARSLRDDGIEATGLVVQGPIVATILDEVERRGADVVVVGSHGHGAAYDLAIGSVSSGVIRKSPRPVLVVPARD